MYLKSSITILFIWLNLTAKGQEIPWVYKQEFTGTNCEAPPLPGIQQLIVIHPLTDPFAWSDGSGRLADFSDWQCRRAEIKHEIEHYEIGEKPGPPDHLGADYSNDTLTVGITVGESFLELTSSLVIPEGNGPFPVLIGIGRSTGSLPPEIFNQRNIAQVTFNFTQVMSHTQFRGQEPINELYPDKTYLGAYSAWSWGISRLIDGLELVAEDLNLDLRRLGITGCSFAGKMALFGAAFDERIALTIAQESGGGGAAAWRVSETLGNVETLARTNYAWFREDMRQFSNSVSKLPHDHHELMAMVAPRAMLILGNPDFKWLADESGYVSAVAAHEVWKAFGIPDRFGYSIVAGHDHCDLPQEQYPEVEAFVEKFLLGNQNANTQVTIHPFDYLDPTRWIAWWGTNDPSFPERPTGPSQVISFEAECAILGENWLVKADPGVSGKKYVTAEMESIEAASVNNSDQISLSFTAERDSVYYVFGYLNCPSSDDDSFWIKMDDGNFEMANGLTTTGWEWVRMGSYPLKHGDHTFTLTFRENGAQLDKIIISNYAYSPEGVGKKAENCE